MQCTFHYFHPTSRNVRFILSIILKFHVRVRVEVKLSKEREFPAGNVTITGAYSGWTEYRCEMNTGGREA
jgi:hypothetical protein